MEKHLIENECPVCDGHGGWYDGTGPNAEPVTCKTCGGTGEFKQEVKIYLKSGQIVELQVKSIERMTHSQTGELIKLTWANSDGEEQLFYVDLSHVAAITRKDIPMKKISDQLT